MANNLKVQIEVSAQDFISDMNKAKKSVDDVSKSSESASKSINDLGNQCSSASKQVSDMSNAEKRAVVAHMENERAAKRAAKEFKELEKNADGVTSSLTRAFSSLKSGDFSGFTDSIRKAGESFKNLNIDTSSTKALLQSVGAQASKFGSGIASSLGQAGMACGALTAGLAVVGVGTYKAIQANQDYHKSLGEFSALTGMTGAALNEMGDNARDMAVKFGSSASEILDSMKLIGSQAPQLLKDSEGMNKVTESAIVLSKATKMSVEDSAKGITTVMNQMGVSANEATEIINSLAAGSKEGSASVEYLSTAFEKTGTIASSVGMSYQQLIGTVEAIAPKFSSADVAGTGLRGTLLKLSTQTNKDFNPAVVGLSKALENLSDANLSDAELTKLVGEANLSVTKTLIDERSEVDRLTKSVTGTNTAYEQMEAQGGLLTQSWDKLKAAVADLWIEFGEWPMLQLLIGAIKGVIGAVTLLITGFKNLQKMVRTAVEIIIALAKKLYSYAEPYIKNLYNSIMDSDVVKFVKALWEAFYKGAQYAIKTVSDIYKKFMQWLGLKKEDFAITASVTTKKDSKADYEKKAQAEAERQAAEAAKKKAEKEAAARSKALDSARKKENEKELKNVEKLAEDVKTLQDELIKKQTLKAHYIYLDLNTDKIDAEIAQLQEKLKNLGAKGDFTGLDTWKSNMTKKIQGLVRDTGITIDLSELSVEEIKGIHSSLTAQKDEDTKKKEADEAKKKKDKEDADKKEAERKEKLARALSDYNSAIEDYKSAYVNYVDEISNHTQTYIDLMGELFSMEPDASAWDWIEVVSSGLADICNQISDTIQSYVALGAAKSAYAKIASEANTKEALSATSATAANVGKAMSGAASSASNLPFPANIAAIMASVSAVLSVIAMIASAASRAKKHAGGGFIKGSTTIGDNVLARLNPGELVLNKRQQTHLFKMLDKGTVATSNAQPELSFRIKGEDLVGAIKNYNNKHR